MRQIKILTAQMFPHLITLSLLMLLGITWGSGYVIARIATLHNIHPLAYSFWQSLGPAFCLCCIVMLRGKKLPLSPIHLKYYFVCGLIGIALPNTNMYFAAPHLPAGILSVIVNIAPILTYLFALIVKQEYFDSVRFTGIICGITGIFIIVIPKASYPTFQEIPWTLLTVISPILFSLCAIYINHARPKNSDSIVLSAGMLMASTLLLAPVVIAREKFYLPQLPLQLGDWMIILEIFLSSCGYIIMFELLNRAGPVFYSLVSGVVVLVGLTWGWIIYQETLDGRQLLAVLLILVAIFLVSFHQRTLFFKPYFNDKT